MKLHTVWIVRDPAPRSDLCDLCDIVWEQRIGRLDNYILGAPLGAWSRERHAVFTEKDEAVAEAIRRLVAARPEREGWIMAEAHREFGYGALKGR